MDIKRLKPIRRRDSVLYRMQREEKRLERVELGIEESVHVEPTPIRVIRLKPDKTDSPVEPETKRGRGRPRKFTRPENMSRSLSWYYENREKVLKRMKNKRMEDRNGKKITKKLDD